MNASRIASLGLLGLSLAVTPSLWADEVPENHALLGVWKVQMTPDNATARAGNQVFDEKFLIIGNEFQAEAFSMYGFALSSYTLTVAEEVTTFTTTSASDRWGTLQWSGYTGGQGVRGVLIWTKPDGSVCRYTFAGNRHEDSSE